MNIPTIDKYRRTTAILVTLFLSITAVLGGGGIAYGVLSLFESILNNPKEENPFVYIFTQVMFGQVLMFGGISYGYLSLTDRLNEYIQIRKPTWNEIYIIGFAPFGLVMIISSISIIGAAIGIEPSQNAVLKINSAGTLYYAFLAILMITAVGPFEELLFRGVIQTRLEEVLTTPKAIIGGGLIFTIAHSPTYGLFTGISAGGLVSLSGILIVSFGFGYIYAKTQNILVVALVHGIYNSLLLMAAYAQGV